MAATKYLKQGSVAGTLAEELGSTTSAGSADTGKLVALDATGRIDSTMMPVGIGAHTKIIVTSENLAANDLVNVYNVSGTATCRKADASAASVGKPAHGYVLASSTSGGNATVYFDGEIPGLTSLTGGYVYLSDTTAGQLSNTAPTTSAHFVQVVGEAIAADTVAFAPHMPILLA